MPMPMPMTERSLALHSHRTIGDTLNTAHSGTPQPGGVIHG